MGQDKIVLDGSRAALSANEDSLGSGAAPARASSLSGAANAGCEQRVAAELSAGAKDHSRSLT
jgi:hypothetical protein